VAILKHTEVPYRSGGGTYGVYVLTADSRVMVTNGDSDKAYQGTNFETYSLFLPPVSSTGQTLSFKKIVWINEDGMAGNDPAVTPYLVALTTDNNLYYTTYAGKPWQGYLPGVRDVSHLPGRGDTVLFTSGQVEFGAFSGPWAWSGLLPSPPNGSTIVAVGGMYALTNDGCHGDCTNKISTFCTGDDTRILRFDWPTWKWEPYVARLTEQNPSHAASYYPISAGYICTNCSPQISTSIIDPHGFGSNTVPPGNPVGPFVHDDSSQRLQFYSPQSAPLAYPLAVCTGSSCAGSCGQRPDGTPCEFDQSNGGAIRVCTAGLCQACGGTNQPLCPGVYPMNRLWDPDNTMLGNICNTSTHFHGTLVSKCATLSSTCGFLYCLCDPYQNQCP
jgi:hypothetical protein